MDGVAIGAGDAAGRVHAAFPANMVIALMAFETHAVLLFHALIDLAPKFKIGGRFSRANFPDVPALGKRLFHCLLTCSTRSVTGSHCSPAKAIAYPLVDHAWF